ncbi:TasA family protein [Halosimplex pelagicum]|uniref:SipW-cognate class signal peptide n=1 Tax=Halosimplex pelagicum TaxID=869886 RepID=A0A7D5P9J9_9EURY|nr:TasA family protein [Halosimplex pelagicum]QLH84143.1 hypothetical protein HZS54_22000 [Halosimplex pelagicum]
MTDEDTNTIELNRRRVLGGIVTIGGAAAAAGAGTFAAFSDSESSDGNSITAGTLDLTTGSNSTIVNVNDVVPGTGPIAESLTLNNDGNISGSLDVIVDSVTSSENTVQEPELDSGDEDASQEGTSNTTGELANELTLTLSLDGTELYSGLASGLQSGDLTSGNSGNGENYSMTADSSANFEIEYSVDSDAGNEIMSDSVQIDLTFELNQNDSQ